MGSFGVVVLAAGSSSRLGRPKQLLRYQGVTLVGRAVQSAVASGADEVVVVLGAHADLVRSALEPSTTWVLNENWAEGMGSSIRCGIAALSDPAEAVVIMLCDQPLITGAHLRALADLVLNGSPIAASSYAGVLGVPAAFSHDLFPRLMELEGDQGARDLIRNAPDVAHVEFEGAEWDVDEEADYDGER